MKKVFVSLALTALVFTACTKDDRGRRDDGLQIPPTAEDNPDRDQNAHNAVMVPAAVLAAFNQRYPDATHIEWKALGDGTFKAEFLRGTVKWQAIFSSTGMLLHEEHK